MTDCLLSTAKTVWIPKQITSSGSTASMVFGEYVTEVGFRSKHLTTLFWTGPAPHLWVAGRKRVDVQAEMWSWLREQRGRKSGTSVPAARALSEERRTGSGVCRSVGGQSVIFWVSLNYEKYCNLLYIQRNLYQEEHTKACVRDECVKADTCVTGTRN